jgi:hypothetical protein
MSSSIFTTVNISNNLKISVHDNLIIVSDEKNTHKINISQIRKFKIIKLKSKSYGFIMGLFFLISSTVLFHIFSWVSLAIIVFIYISFFLFLRQIDYYLIIQSTTFFKKIKINNQDKDKIKSLVYDISNLKK